MTGRGIVVTHRGNFNSGRQGCPGSGKAERATAAPGPVPGVDVVKSWKSRGYCGAPTPQALIEGSPLAPYCKNSADHKSNDHEDPYGVTWSASESPK